MLHPILVMACPTHAKSLIMPSPRNATAAELTQSKGYTKSKAHQSSLAHSKPKHAKVAPNQRHSASSSI